jgi:hypothetical protein
MESVAGLTWNGWPNYRGISGRFAVENAVKGNKSAGRRRKVKKTEGGNQRTDDRPDFSLKLDCCLF